MAQTKSIYISIDIETNGPNPFKHSMLSFGAAAVNDNFDKIISTFTINLEELPGHTFDPKTMEWWNKQEPAAWEVCRKNPVKPEIAIPQFVKWARSFPHKPTLVAYPAGFDFTFLSPYLETYSSNHPFGFSCLDLKSFAMALLGTSFRDTIKKKMPVQWFKYEGKHTHVALDDCIEQAYLFMEMIKCSKSRLEDHRKILWDLLEQFMQTTGYKIPNNKLEWLKSNIE